MTISHTAFILKSGHEYMVEMAIFNVQRAVTPQLGNSEFWFMCFAHCLIMFYIFMKFHEDNRADTST